MNGPHYQSYPAFSRFACQSNPSTWHGWGPASREQQGNWYGRSSHRRCGCVARWYTHRKCSNLHHDLCVVESNRPTTWCRVDSDTGGIGEYERGRSKLDERNNGSLVSSLLTGRRVLPSITLQTVRAALARSRRVDSRGRIGLCQLPTRGRRRRAMPIHCAPIRAFRALTEHKPKFKMCASATRLELRPLPRR